MPRLTFLGAAKTMRWVTGLEKPRTVFLTHGETEAADALGARITRERGFRTAAPGLGETVELGAP